MKELKPISNFLSERRRQDICSGCGKSIEDQEKECPTCGAFPHKAYHERAAAKTLGISKWLQNAPVMQPNQKLSENITKPENMNNIIKFGEFVESRIHESETEWDFLDQACLEEGLDEMIEEMLNEGVAPNSSELASKFASAISTYVSKISKGMGQQSVDPKIEGILKGLSKGIVETMSKAGGNPGEFRKALAGNKEMKKISDIFANSLRKLIDSAKSDPTVLFSKQFGQTLSGLYLVRKVAKAAIAKQDKGFADSFNTSLSKAVNMKSATPMNLKPKKASTAKPGAKPAETKTADAKPAETKPEAAPQPASSTSATSTETTTTTPEDKKTA
jgi:hypothetical protein